MWRLAVIDKENLVSKYMYSCDGKLLSIHFYMKCPRCGKYQIVQRNRIPLEIREEVKNKYQDISDFVNHRLCLEEERISLIMDM